MPRPHVSLQNLSRSTILSHRFEVADTFLARFLGLLGRPSLPLGTALWLRPSSGVHTLGMRFPIDVVALSRNMTVVSLDRNLRPWRVAAAHRSTHSVLELPAGAIDAAQLAVGDQLALEP